MNLERAYFLVQIVAGIAVVASLIYLALQIRQANRQAQGVAHADWLTIWNDTIRGWVRDPETVRTLQRGFSDFSDLSRVEQAVFAQQLAALINHWHLAADLFEQGLLDEALYRGALEVVLSVCSTEGGGYYLKTNGSFSAWSTAPPDGRGWRGKSSSVQRPRSLVVG